MSAPDSVNIAVQVCVERNIHLAGSVGWMEGKEALYGVRGEEGEVWVVRV